MQFSRHIQYFIRKKIKEDPLWQRVKVVYSGHDVPGEGGPRWLRRSALCGR